MFKITLKKQVILDHRLGVKQYSGVALNWKREKAFIDFIVNTFKIR